MGDCKNKDFYENNFGLRPIFLVSKIDWKW